MRGYVAIDSFGGKQKCASEFEAILHSARRVLLKIYGAASMKSLAAIDSPLGETRVLILLKLPRPPPLPKKREKKKKIIPVLQGST